MLLFTLCSSSASSLLFLKLWQAPTSHCLPVNIPLYLLSFYFSFALCLTSPHLCHLSLLQLKSSLSSPPACWADIVMLTRLIWWKGAEKEATAEDQEKWRAERREGHHSSPSPVHSFALYRCLLMSHSAMFNVNIFTALLVTRTSGMALTNLFSPQDQIFICPPIVSLLISPKPSVFNPYIMSFLLLWLPLMLFLPLLPPAHILQLHNYTPISLYRSAHSTYTMYQYICHIQVTLHMKLTHQVGVICTTLFSHVYFSRLLAKIRGRTTLRLSNKMWPENRTDVL